MHVWITCITSFQGNFIHMLVSLSGKHLCNKSRSLGMQGSLTAAEWQQEGVRQQLAEDAASTCLLRTLSD